MDLTKMDLSKLQSSLSQLSPEEQIQHINDVRSKRLIARQEKLRAPRTASGTKKPRSTKPKKELSAMERLLKGLDISSLTPEQMKTFLEGFNKNDATDKSST